MEAGSESRCCKVGRTIDKYGFFEFDRELRRRRKDGASLRDLATLTNSRILERKFAEADLDLVGEPEGIYRTLTDDDVRQSKRTELRSKLEGHIDVDELVDDFVSYVTIRKHLQDCLDIDTSRELNVDPEAERGTIEWARSQSQKVIERSLERLRSANEMDTGPLDVHQSIRVTCADCGSSYRLHDLLDEPQCDCPPREET